jgi:hypothetical protein
MLRNAARWCILKSIDFGFRMPRYLWKRNERLAFLKRLGGTSHLAGPLFYLDLRIGAIRPAPLRDQRGLAKTTPTMNAIASAANGAWRTALARV